MLLNRGFALGTGTAADIVGIVATRAQALGYDSFWMNHPGEVDGIAELKTAAATTTRIDLGIGVVPLHLRTPGNIRDGVVAAGLPIDRLLLGLGSSNPQALARARQGVADLRDSLGCRIAVAALGPKMCRLAGEVADAVLLNWLTPAHARTSAEWVRSGAQDARRQTPKMYAYVRLAIGNDARARVDEQSSRYMAIPAYAAHFERMDNVQLAATAIAATSVAEAEAQLAEWEAAVDEVVLRALPVGATLDEHLELLDSLAPGGAGR